MDTVQNDNEDEIDELINDFDNEFIAAEEIELTDNPNECFDIRSECPRMSMLLTKGPYTLKNEWQTKKRKKPEENTPITWKRNVSPHYRENCLLEGRVFYQFDKSASGFDIYE